MRTLPAGSTFTPLGSFLLVPDLSGARGHVFLARDVTPTAEPHPDPDEELEIETVRLDRLLAPAPGARDGYLDDAGSLVALSMARSHLEALRPPR